MPLVYSSGPRELDYLFGRALAFLPFAFAHSRGAFGARSYTLAVRHGQVVGAVALYGGEAAARLDLGLAAAVLGFYRLGAPAVLGRGLRLAALVPPPDRHTLFVAQLGVRPDQQGQGVGTALLAHAAARARAEGRARVALDVAVTNARAQALYERLGFTVVRERPWTHGGDVPAQRRMELRL